jgi:peptidoglycan/xylan/chitin deacetylase (PgdA/CDA1 family)
MWRRPSRYPRTPYGRAGRPRTATAPQPGLTRRGLLGVVAIIGGGGLIEIWRGTSHHADAVARNTASRPSIQPVRLSHQGAIAPKPAHGHGDAPPSRGHRDQYGTHEVQPSGHGGGHSQRQRRAEDHVTLPPAQVRVRSRPIYKVSDIDPHPPKKAIALTVDDGPDPDWTPKVLRLLDKHHMQASFCVVGIHADAYPGLIRDIHKAGHVIVNHSYTHVQPFARQSEKRIVAEITRTQHAIERAAKVTPELFRSPGGEWSHFVFRAIASYGLTPLDWDVDPEDWARPGRRKIQHAMLRGRPGDIVLCHDGGGNRSETVRALRRVLPAWKHRGYTTIPLVVPKQAKHAKHRHHTATT